MPAALPPRRDEPTDSDVPGAHRPADRPAGLRRGFVGALVVTTALLALPAAAYTVDTTADSGMGSLRQAILDANANVGADVIDFAIGTCPCTITLLTVLPTITDTVEINGYTEGGAAANSDATATDATLQIVLDAGGLAQALRIAAPDSRVRGLDIVNYSSRGIRIDAAGDGTTIDGNFIGTDRTGGAASGFAGQSVGIAVLDGADGVTIGGTAPAARNLLSGNSVDAVVLQADSTVVAGNLIGTDASGTAALPNGTGAAPHSAAVVINVGSSNRIGGPTAADRNVISGNAGDALQISAGAGSNLIQGNYIGVDATGNAPLPNARHGVVFYTAAAGAAAADNVVDGNVIAAQPRKGIAVDGPVFTGTVITDNFLGVGADGVTALGNGFGPDPLMAGNGPDPAVDVLNGATAQVAGNRILYNSTGVLVRSTEFVGAGALGDGALLAGSSSNCVVFNGEGVVNETGTTTPFEMNWWGAPDGPSGAGPGGGDSVSADVDFDPFLTAAPAGCPSSVSVLEIPTVSAAGLGALALLLLVAAVIMGRRRPT